MIRAEPLLPQYPLTRATIPIKHPEMQAVSVVAFNPLITRQEIPPCA
jgi:hypothetical protein